MHCAIEFLNRSRKGGVLAALCAAAILPLTAHAATTATRDVTGSNGVVYEIVDAGALTVTVSSINQSKFQNLTEAIDLVIPATVEDAGTNSDYQGMTFTVTAMNSSAFKGCTMIRSVTIEGQIAEIPTDAFNGCTGLETATFPASVTKIGTSAFQGCTSLSAAGDLAGVTFIDGYAFKGCAALPSITLPEGLKTLNSEAFAECTSLRTASLPSTLTLTSSKIFSGCTALTDVTISEGVETLGSNSFEGCTSLKSPVIPASLKTIGNSAFSGCTALGEVTLPAGVSVGGNAYEGARITALNFPAAGCSIHPQAFRSVSPLTEVNIPGTVAAVPAECFSDCPDLRTVTLGEGITSIGNSAFSGCSQLAETTLPESLDVIDRKAFSGCSKLAAVDFPATMTFIGELAFQNCTSLESITLPAGATLEDNCFSGTELSAITWPSAPMGTLGRPFGEQHRITEMSFPAWMTEIPATICSGWSALTTVNLSEGITGIGENAFMNSGLTALKFPASMRTVGKSAFENCSALASLELNEGLETLMPSSMSGCAALTSLTLPASLRTLGDSAFKDCTGLAEVTVTPGLTEVGSNAFLSCAALTTVNLPETVESLGENAFAHCSSLNDIPFPASLKTIGTQAFAFCSSFGPVTLSEGMTVGEKAFLSAGVTAINFPDKPCTFEANAFSDNEIMTEVKFPSWMTAIPTGFCYRWSKLTTATLHEGITEIGADAFFQCGNLHDVDFPKSLTLIGARAFKECTSGNPPFGEVHLGSDVEIGDEAFARANVTAIIFDGCATFDKDVFANVTTMQTFTFPECMTEIPDGFCKEWKSLKKVILPSTLKKIGKDVFNGCQALNIVCVNTPGQEEGGESGDEPDELRFELPASLESIGDQAFMSTGVIDVTFPDQKIEIGASAFANSKVQEVVIPAWMDVVPDYLFSGCGSLKSLTWEPHSADDAPRSVTIGTGAFKTASQLTEINLPDVDATIGLEAFSSCTTATTINWGDTNAKVTLSKSAFENCSKLKDVTLPASVTEIPERCFQACYELGRFDIGAGVTSIGQAAFYNAGLTEVVWNDVITTLGVQAFWHTTLPSIDIPGTISLIPDNCFTNCTNLATVTFNEGLTAIGKSAFHNCSQLVAAPLPSTVKTIDNNAFYECVRLASLELNEGLESVGQDFIAGTKVLKELTLPSTLNSVSEFGFRNSSLEHIVSNAENLTLGSFACMGCTSLRTFHSTGHIAYIGSLCFSNLTNLTDFTLEDPDDYVERIDNSAFENCRSLRAVPNLYKTDLRRSAFAGCSSLVSVTLPEEGAFCTNSTSSANDRVNSYLNGATSLQSVVYPYTGPRFCIKAADIQNAPLKGISYSYADDIVPLGQAGATILEYDGPEVTDKAKLYVKRGQKWKYIEAGYGKRFDIEEMIDPEMTVEGDIFSTYIHSGGLNYNHYTATLRWEVNLSDLDPVKPTKVNVFMDGNPEPIARVKFEAPAVSGDEILVNVTVNDESKRFESNFVAPTTSTSTGEPLYVMSYAVQEPTMRFDSYSTKRLDALDFYGYKSWFVMVYEFDCDLEQPSVPASYRFSARMDGFEASQLVNNTDCAIGADGLRYGPESIVVNDLDAVPCDISIAVAEPSLEFDGLYTTEQILADTDHHLYVTKPWVNGDNRTYSVTYSIDPALMNERGYKYGSTTGAQYIINKMIAKEVIDDETLRDVGTSTSPSRTGEGAVAIERQFVPQPGNRYQIITHSDFRGTFGSAVIEIPDAPTLTASLAIKMNDHAAENLGGHERFPYDAVLYLYPDVSAMGYENPMPAEDVYHLGLWRSVDSYDRETSRPMLMALDETETSAEDLIHHTSGQTHSADTHCNVCLTNATGIDHDNENSEIRYNDVFDVDAYRMFNVSYQPRLYVKVPSTKLRSSTRWMVADAKVQVLDADALTGLESLRADGASDGDALWFDLQGRAVPAPAPGQTYIRVTPQGASKVIKMTNL